MEIIFFTIIVVCILIGLLFAAVEDYHVSIVCLFVVICCFGGIWYYGSGEYLDVVMVSKKHTSECENMHFPEMAEVVKYSIPYSIGGSIRGKYWTEITFKGEKIIVGTKPYENTNTK